MHTVPGGLWMRPMGSARSIGYIVRKVSKPVQWYAYTNVDHTSIQVSLVVNAQITRHVTPKYFVSWTISPPPTFRFSPAVGCAPTPYQQELLWVENNPRKISIHRTSKTGRFKKWNPLPSSESPQHPPHPSLPDTKAIPPQYQCRQRPHIY